MTANRRWVSETPGLDHLRVERASAPTPREGELVVRIVSAALNFSDLLMIDDQYQVRPDRPFTPGQELAGVVTESGAGCRFTVGARVASKVLWGHLPATPSCKIAWRSPCLPQ